MHLPPAARCSQQCPPSRELPLAKGSHLVWDVMHLSTPHSGQSYRNPKGGPSHLKMQLCGALHAPELPAGGGWSPAEMESLLCSFSFSAVPPLLFSPESATSTTPMHLNPIASSASHKFTEDITASDLPSTYFHRFVQERFLSPKS